MRLSLKNLTELSPAPTKVEAARKAIHRGTLETLFPSKPKFMGLKLELDWNLDSGRRSDKEREIGNSALAFRLVRNGNGLYGVKLRKNMDAYRRCVRVDGKADNARR